MSKKKYSYFVGVLQNDGTTRFVTKIVYCRKYAKWEAGKKALEMSMTCADDLVLGLLLNLHYAFTVKVPAGIEFTNGEDL